MEGDAEVIAKAEAERRRLIGAAKAKLEAQEATVVDSVPAEAKRKNAASKTQPKGQSKVGTEPVVATAEPVKVKAPYNPAPLSGAPAAGKAPQKGQLPLGLLRMLVKRNPGSERLRAALAAAEGGAAAPAKKAKKAKK